MTKAFICLFLFISIDLVFPLNNQLFESNVCESNSLNELKNSLVLSDSPFKLKISKQIYDFNENSPFKVYITDINLEKVKIDGLAIQALLVDSEKKSQVVGSWNLPTEKAPDFKFLNCYSNKVSCK
jgi:hypothetical protein